MSVFEDLIDELKNENLLEETVIDTKRADAAAHVAAEDTYGDPAPARGLDDPQAAAETQIARTEIDLPQIEKPVNEREFFRKRAMDEVSSLQMVEHVLSGVEREHMKVASESYDDLNAKKALHRFIQVSDDIRSSDHAEAEFALRQETESWGYALYERDRNISVANIRRFCEESRPILSSQALIALARFYRNSPYSEDVRGKFDYVMTRLFSRDAGEETREPLFVHAEMIGHIVTLYANWSSIALYTNGDDKAEVELAATRFNEFAAEIKNAESFDALLKEDFFNRVRLYKEECAELFYVPEVAAAAIRCNLAIGNRYVELIALERTRLPLEKIGDKYGDEYDQIVSNAAGKTLLLENLLALDPGMPDFEPSEPAPSRPKPAQSRADAVDREPSFDLFGVNKWLLAACIAAILLSGGLYIWAEKFAGGEEGTVTAAKPVSIDDAEIKPYLKSPLGNQETFYAVTSVDFDGLTSDKKKELLGKVRVYAADRGMTKVTLMNNKGQAVGYASKDRLELVQD